MGTLVLNGATSGATTLQPTDATTQTITFPSGNGTVITTASSGKVIPTAALPAGTVLQVVSATYATSTSTTSTTAVDTGLTATITPTSNTSKIFVIITNPVRTVRASGGYSYSNFTLVRGTTTLVDSPYYFYTSYNAETSTRSPIPITYLDSPATTAATTYKMQMYSSDASTTTYSCVSNLIASITLIEIAA